VEAARTLSLTPLEIAADSLGFFRWGRVAGGVLVTNDAGDWALLSEAELADLLAGRVADGHPRFTELQGKGFLRDGLDVDALTGRVAQRNRHMRRGPHVHVVTLTRRGTEAGANGGGAAAGADMSAETAERIVEFALQSTSPALTFELQGEQGEPLHNVDVLRHLVETAQTRCKRTVGKALTFRVLSNLSAMTEAHAEWLLANDVQVVARLDGPAAIHDANRAWTHAAAHADVVRWIDVFTRRQAERTNATGAPISAVVTATRRVLDDWRAVVDEYVARGLRSIHFQPLHAAGVDPATWATIGYTPAQYLDVYRQILQYVVELNQRGVDLIERVAAVVASKILSAADTGVVDLQSPNGGGSSQIAYGVDGRVFPDDAAQRSDADGDGIFLLGDVRRLSPADLVRHPTVRAIAAASLLDAQPMCADCWNKPFCGYSPVRNFLDQGDLVGQRPHCFECKHHMAVSTQLFGWLAGGADSATAQMLRRWVESGARLVDGRLSLPPR
jgi:sulfatase maturation enzyme AslB (radical SAM superfamily)